MCVCVLDVSLDLHVPRERGFTQRMSCMSKGCCMAQQAGVVLCPENGLGDTQCCACMVGRGSAWQWSKHVTEMDIGVCCTEYNSKSACVSSVWGGEAVLQEECCCAASTSKGIC